MNLLEKYDLLDVIAENETRTYLARERSTVRMVMVHILLPAPTRISLLELVLRTRERPASPGRLQILDLGEHEGNPFVVTEIIPGFRTLREWLQAELAYAGSAAPPRPASFPATSPSRPETRRDPGEFTQLFQAVMGELPGAGRAGSNPPRPVTPLPAEAVAQPQSGTALGSTAPPLQPPAPAGAPEPGEFTRMFQTVPPSPPSPPPLQTEPPPAFSAEPTPPSREPGEFTRMFQSPLTHIPAPPPAWTAFPSPQGPLPPQDPSPSSSPTSVPAREPGEFTRMFQQPVHGTVQAVQPPASPELPAVPPVGPEPGEFTRMFQSPLTPTPLEEALPASGIQPPVGPGSAASAPWHSPAGMPAPSRVPLPQPTPPLGGTGAPSAGEFTRLFGTPSGSAPQVAPTGPAGPMGGATQLFSTPAPGASAEPIAPAGTPFGPSEFTRVVQAAPVETAEAAAPASPIHPPTRPAASHSYLPLLIISGSMLVIALMLVIYFVLRR